MSPPSDPCPTQRSSDGAQQLRLKDEFTLLVLFTLLVSLVILPAHCFIALLANDVANDMPPRGHVAFHRLSLLDIDHAVEKKSLAVLATEVPRHDVVKVRQVCLAGLRTLSACRHRQPQAEKLPLAMKRTLHPKILAELK